MVDKDDRVVGVTNKEEAHRLGYIHRVVAVFVFDKDGKLYAQEHIISNNALDHSIGGHVRRGESYDEAAAREAHEELGINDPLTRVTTFLSQADFKHMFTIYETTPPSSWKFMPNKEVQKIIPLSIADIVEKMNSRSVRFTYGFRATMGKYIDVKKLPYVLNPLSPLR